MKRVAVLLLLLLLLFLPAVAQEQAKVIIPESAPAEGYTPEEMLSLWYQIGSYLRESGLYPFVQLQKGDRGYEVRALQVRLAELGYYSKAIADNFGSGTHTAMRKFESLNGLPVNGVASVEDQKRLFSPYALANTGAPIEAPKNKPKETPAPDDGDDSSGPGWLLPYITIDPNKFKPIVTPLITLSPTPTPTLFFRPSPLITLNPIIPNI